MARPIDKKININFIGKNNKAEIATQKQNN